VAVRVLEPLAGGVEAGATYTKGVGAVIMGVLAMHALGNSLDRQRRFLDTGKQLRGLMSFANTRFIGGDGRTDANRTKGG